MWLFSNKPKDPQAQNQTPETTPAEAEKIVEDINEDDAQSSASCEDNSNNLEDYKPKDYVAAYDNPKKLKLDDIRRVTCHCDGEPLTWEQVDQEYEIVDECRNAYFEQEYIGNDAKKRLLLQKMQATFQKTFPRSVKSTATLIQFLVARKWKLEAACKMYIKRMFFVRTLKPHRVTYEDIFDQIKENKGCWVGFDKEKRPVISCFPGRHFPGKGVQIWKYICFMVERGRRMLPKGKDPQVSQFVAIYDRVGFSLANFDLFAMRLFGVMGDYWPEFLGKVYVCRANWVYHTLFAVVKPFLDEKTIKKINIFSEVEGKDEETKAKNTFDKIFSPDFESRDCMLKMFGGNLGWPTLEQVKELHENNWTMQDLSAAHKEESN